MADSTEKKSSVVWPIIGGVLGALDPSTARAISLANSLRRTQLYNQSVAERGGMTKAEMQRQQAASSLAELMAQSMRNNVTVNQPSKMVPEPLPDGGDAFVSMPVAPEASALTPYDAQQQFLASALPYLAQISPGTVAQLAVNRPMFGPGLSQAPTLQQNLPLGITANMRTPAGSSMTVRGTAPPAGLKAQEKPQKKVKPPRFETAEQALAWGQEMRRKGYTASLRLQAGDGVVVNIPAVRETRAPSRRSTAKVKDWREKAERLSLQLASRMTTLAAKLPPKGLPESMWTPAQRQAVTTYALYQKRLEEIQNQLNAVGAEGKPALIASHRPGSTAIVADQKAKPSEAVKNDPAAGYLADLLGGE